jgi:hypothetical protein
MRSIQLEAPGLVPGLRLFRNNVGVAELKDGRRLRYGLAVGSSDLVGWVPVTVRPEHVGTVLARFLAVEVKSATGRPTAEQLNFLDAVRQAGGIATIARSTEDLRSILRS